MKYDVLKLIIYVCLKFSSFSLFENNKFYIYDPNPFLVERDSTYIAN